MDKIQPTTELLQPILEAWQFFSSRRPRFPSWHWHSWNPFFIHLHFLLISSILTPLLPCSLRFIFDHLGLDLAQRVSVFHEQILDKAHCCSERACRSYADVHARQKNGATFKKVQEGSFRQLFDTELAERTALFLLEAFFLCIVCSSHLSTWRGSSRTTSSLASLLLDTLFHRGLAGPHYLLEKNIWEIWVSARCIPSSLVSRGFTCHVLVKFPCDLQPTGMRCVRPYCFTGRPRPLGTCFSTGSMVLFPWSAPSSIEIPTCGFLAAARPGRLLCHRQSSLLITRLSYLALHHFWPHRLLPPTASVNCLICFLQFFGLNVLIFCLLRFSSVQLRIMLCWL